MHYNFTIDPTHLRPLMTCKSANEMWEKPRFRFEQATAENQYFLRQQFYDYKFQRDHEVSTHITAIESMVNQLVDAGVKMDDEHIINMILCTLLSCYCQVVADWDSFDDDKNLSNL